MPKLAIEGLPAARPGTLTRGRPFHQQIWLHVAHWQQTDLGSRVAAEVHGLHLAAVGVVDGEVQGHLLASCQLAGQGPRSICHSPLLGCQFLICLDHQLVPAPPHLVQFLICLNHRLVPAPPHPHRSSSPMSSVPMENSQSRKAWHTRKTSGNAREGGYSTEPLPCSAPGL